MAMDRRTAARQIAMKLASQARAGGFASGPITVDRAIVEEYVKEYTQKWEIPFDERMEQQLRKYGINILNNTI